MVRVILRKFSSFPQLPKCSFVPQKYTGPSLSELKNIRKNRLNPALTTYHSEPLVIHQGYKQWLFDINGKRYLDMFGGICTVSVGHCHPKINSAVSEQMTKLNHVSNVYMHPKIHEYALKITDKFPDDLKVVYFVNSGSEANDLAVLMARVYTNKFDIITLENCYHGMTYQTMALTSSSNYKYPLPQISGVHHVMNPDVYRGIWGGKNCRDSPVQTTRTCSCQNSECKAKNNYIDQFKNIFKYDLSKNSLAAFFAESIQGVGGTVQFPRQYLKEVHEIVKEAEALFVSDEVQTGFGRTGSNFWGFENHGIKPDIVTMAKGIGNGFPLAAVVTTKEIANALTKSTHFNTFGGNPVACTVGSTVLDIIEEEKLQENSKIIGTHLLIELEKLRSQYPIIGDVRGKGLMIGVELIENDGTKTPIKPEKYVNIWDHCKDMGLILGKGGVSGNVLRIKPPMCITLEDANFTVEVIKESLQLIK